MNHSPEGLKVALCPGPETVEREREREREERLFDVLEINGNFVILRVKPLK